MTKVADRERVPLPRASTYLKSFRKDWEALSRSGRYDMRLLREAMLLLLVKEEPLGPEWLDHALKGQWLGHRECHIGGDFLLIYSINEDRDEIVFVRAGTHADLFRG